MSAPTRAQWKSFWMGLQSWTEAQGLFPSMAEVRQSQTSVFARRLTIGPADQDSDDVISTLSMGDWSGGGQIEEMTGADQTRYWWGVFDGRSPRQAALPPLVENPDTGKPSGATGTSYPLGVVNDTAYFAFGTDIAGYNESADTWYTRESMTNAPAGKCIEFNGSLYVPTGGSGYSIITESGTGNPVVTLVTGANDPTAAPSSPTAFGPNPKAVHFCVFEGNKLFALSRTGGICYSFTGASGSWVWDYNDALEKYPNIETGATPRRLIPFFNRAGTPALFVTTSRGVLIYDRNNVALNETPIQYPQHPDVGVAATVWRPGEDLWIGTGLDTVRFTSSNVAIPLSGVSRDSGVPSGYRGSIKDLEPELSTLFALVGGVSDTFEAYAYAAKLSASGTGNGQFDAPRGITPDSNGNLFVADTNNERVQKLTAVPAYTAKFGSSGSGDGQFAADNGAYDVACDSSNRVYVVDRGNHRVQRFTNLGTYSNQFGSFDDGTPTSSGSSTWTLQGTFGSTGAGNNNFDTPGQVAVDSDGNTYTADTANGRLIKRNSSGSFVSKLDGFGGITGVCVDSSDRVYIVFTDGIVKYTSSFVVQWAITGSFVFSFRHCATDGTFLYITCSNDSIRKYRCSNGAFVTSWGTPGTNNNSYNGPWGIAVRGSNVFIVDRGNSRVKVTDKVGTFVRKWTVPANSRGCAISPNTNVYVADFSGDTIHRYTEGGFVIDSFAQDNPDGIAITSGGIVWVTNATTDNLAEWEEIIIDPIAASPPEDGKFNLPESIAINRTTGRIYVADTGNHRIQYFSSAHAHLGTFGGSGYNATTGAATSGSGNGQLHTPVAIAVNEDSGDVYVVDQGNHRIQRFSADGVYLGKWGSEGTGNTQFDHPESIAIESSTGNVLVGDSGVDQFREYSSLGAYIQKFGSTGTGDGDFRSITGITYSLDGLSIYAVDATNTRVTRIDNSSVTDTIRAVPHLQGWTGTGWHGLWEGPNNSNIPTWMEVMSVTGGYRLWWGGTDGLAYSMKLRRTMHNPREGYIAGVDRFAATGYVETASADMGMLGFTKIASHVIVFMREATDTETVEVEYAIDDGGWTTLGTVTSPGRTVLPFNESLITDTETVSRGLNFNWIRFRISLARGSNIFSTPVIRAFNLHFLKVPQNSSSFQFTIPLPKRVWKGRGPAEMNDGLIELLEAHEMVFLRHQDRLYRGRLAQVTGVDATGSDFSGIRNVTFLEIQEDGGS